MVIPAQPSRRDLAIVAGFVLVCGLMSWGAAWNVDEPFFLAIARHILLDPLHPLAFDFNWYGRSAPMAAINNTPPLFGYLLAGALKISGGGEFRTRALFFPFDLAASWSLLALAARFLKRPLWPTLILLAGPAWLVNMPHLMAERVMAGFALPALWLMVVAADEDDPRAFWCSSACAAVALLSKYNALFLLLPAVSYARGRGVSWRRLAAWSAAALSGVVLYQAIAFFSDVSAARAAWTVTAQAAVGAWSAPSHKARSVLAFIGGLSGAAALWGFRLSPSRRVVWGAAIVCAILFAPVFDWAPLVRPIDRAAGWALSFGTCVSFAVLLLGPRTRGAALWAPWVASILCLQLVYWSVLARFIVFLLPPLTFWLWERLEAERPAELGVLGGATLAVVLALGTACAIVDRTYADAQRRAARDFVVSAVAQRRRAWCATHWGLQEYALASGARELDAEAGGWAQVRPGDRVLTARVNSNVLRPAVPIRAQVTTVLVDSPIPLRLFSGWKAEGGFYSNVMGFLPWSISREPVDEIAVVDAL